MTMRYNTHGSTNTRDDMSCDNMNTNCCVVHFELSLSKIISDGVKVDRHDYLVVLPETESGLFLEDPVRIELTLSRNELEC